MSDDMTTAAAPFSLYDMHCHLDFATNATQVAADARAAGLALLSCTVDPRDYAAACEAFAPYDNVRVGLGMHPWWVGDGRVGPDEVVLFEELAPGARVIGEVGLDFVPRRCTGDSSERQIDAFERACAVAAASSDPSAPKVVSIHAAHSATTVLDILQASGCAERCRCIMHWFSGSSAELRRAIDLGCWFSVNRMTVSTKRWREYAKVVPLDRLLLETDEPPEGTAVTAAQFLDSLAETQAFLEDVLGRDMQAQLAHNAHALLP